ncbi:MAG: ferredoxin [Candidatus Beckwithbacteria bacterium]|nr:ferredoxin [Patescibacteria group bacterium]
MKNIKINQDLCMGCGSCVAICPKVFAMEDGKAKVVGEAIGEEENVKMARDACPAGAISFEE